MYSTQIRTKMLLALAAVCLSALVSHQGVAQSQVRPDNPEPEPTIQDVLTKLSDLENRLSGVEELVKPVPEVSESQVKIDGELQQHKRSLDRIEELVEPPTIFRKVGEGLLVNAVWSTVVSDDSEPNPLGFLATVVSILVGVGRLVQLVRSNEDKKGVKWIPPACLIILGVMFGVIVFSDKLVSDNPSMSGQLSSVRNRLEAIEGQMKRLESVENTSQDLRKVVEGVRTDMTNLKTVTPPNVIKGLEVIRNESVEIREEVALIRSQLSGWFWPLLRFVLLVAAVLLSALTFSKVSAGRPF